MRVRISSLRQERERRAAVKRETLAGIANAQLPQRAEPTMKAAHRSPQGSEQ